MPPARRKIAALSKVANIDKRELMLRNEDHFGWGLSCRVARRVTIATKFKTAKPRLAISGSQCFPIGQWRIRLSLLGVLVF